MYIHQMTEDIEQNCNARARTKIHSDRSHHSYCARSLQLSPWFPFWVPRSRHNVNSQYQDFPSLQDLTCDTAQTPSPATAIQNRIIFPSTRSFSIIEWTPLGQFPTIIPLYSAPSSHVLASRHVTAPAHVRLWSRYRSSQLQTLQLSSQDRTKSSIWQAQ